MDNIISKWYEETTANIDIDKDFNSIDGPGLYCVIASLPESLYVTPTAIDDDNYRAHQATSIIYYSKLETQPTRRLKKKLQLRIVPVNSETFHSPCIAIPYDIDELEEEVEWLFVEPRHEWNEYIYESCMQDLINLSKSND